MSTSEPEAEVEYSRGSRASRGRRRASAARPDGGSRGARSVAGLGLLGALALVVAEFLPLLSVRSSQRGSGVIATVQTGSHDSFALVPIAIIAVLFVVAALRQPSWPPLVALLALGLIALGIALLGDLPDARATGLVTVSQGNYASAQASPGSGFLLETLGAIALIAAGGAGLLVRAPWMGSGR